MSDNAPIVITAPAQLLQDLKADVFDLFTTEEDAKADAKIKIEDFASDYNIDKKLLTKYLKAAYKETTDEAKVLAQGFEAIEKAMG